MTTTKSGKAAENYSSCHCNEEAACKSKKLKEDGALTLHDFVTIARLQCAYLQTPTS